MPTHKPGDPAAPGGLGRPAADHGTGSHADAPTRVSESPGIVGPPVGADDFERPTIDGYDLHQELHRGGQGVVYLATQRGTRRQVALKVLLEGPFASKTARMRFEREVELAASLRHPGIVTILESGISKGRYFFAMDYIDGQRLDAYLREARPGLRETLVLFCRIADAINFAHQRGVIHRDLKPSNILITGDGQPHVLDFGLAKSATSDPDPDRTTLKVLSTAGQVVGTLAYMSPEQARGAEDLDVRSDVYALGVILYEALLGRMPYDVSGPLGDILGRIATDEPCRPRLAQTGSRFGRAIDDELETILLKALDKEPERRYQTAGSLARDLTRYLNNEPIIAKPASGLYMLRKLLKRYRLQAIAAGIVLSTLLICLVILVFQYRSEVRLRRDYEEAEKRAQVAAEQALRSARVAEAAESRERQARRRAEDNERDTLLANDRLREALIQQMVHRGELARLNGDLAVARDSYWDAFLADNGRAMSQWALRQYYLESGDDLAVQLALQPEARIALSPDGTRAAIAGPGPGIVVCDTGNGAALRWLSTAGPATVLSIARDGSVAAAGERWIDLWGPQGGLPLASFDVEGRQAIRDLIALPDLTGVYAVTDQAVQFFARDAGGRAGRTRLSGSRNGDALLMPDGAGLLVPTTAGLEHVQPLQTDGLRGTTVWSGGPARAVVRSGATVHLLADGLYTAPAGSTLEFAQRVRLREDFDLLAASPDGEQVAVAGRDGRVVTIQGGRQERYWRITRDTVRALRWSADGDQLLTLDGGGALTRWIAPERAAERTRISPRGLDRWDISEDGSTAILLDSDGRLRAFRRGGEAPTEIKLPSLLQRLTGRSTEDLLFSTDETGASVLVLDGRRLWHYDTQRQRSTPLRWRLPRLSRVTHLDLSWDGKRAAFYTQSAAEDRQYIAIRQFEPGAGNDPGGGWSFYDLAGSSVLSMTFLPRSHTLLVARANGALLLIDPEEAGSNPREAPAPWLVLDAPASAIAFSRDATHVALACDDGRIRVLDPATGEETGFVRDPRPVRSLGFDPTGTVLMIRFEDGTLDLYDYRQMERILRWNAAAGERAMASWFGTDELLLTDAGGLLLLGFGATDRRVTANQGFALQRDIAAAAAESDFGRAWSRTRELAEINAALGGQTRIALLELILRGRRNELPAACEEELRRIGDPVLQLRLGHAAYHGGRFALADRLLAAATLLPEVDRYTAWRIAECDYLLGRYDEAAAAFERLLQDEALPPENLARIRLELLAALMLAERTEQARSHFNLYRIRQPSGGARQSDTMGMMATLVIGDLLLGNEAESQVSSSFRNLLTVFKTQWLDYRDDIEFFAGELERQRGKSRAAEARYQRCLELARDDWPANWARLRLVQLAQSRTAE